MAGCQSAINKKRVPVEDCWDAVHQNFVYRLSEKKRISNSKAVESAILSPLPLVAEGFRQRGQQGKGKGGGSWTDYARNDNIQLRLLSTIRALDALNGMTP